MIHSATKYLNGHNDVLGGVVLGTASYRRGGAAEDDGLGPGARSLRLLAARARAEDARRARAAPERERHGIGDLARRAARRVRACTTPDCRRTPTTRSRRTRCRGSAECSPSNSPAADWRAERLLKRLTTHPQRPEPRRRGHDRLRAALHLACAHDRRGARRGGDPGRVRPDERRRRGGLRPDCGPGGRDGHLVVRCGIGVHDEHCSPPCTCRGQLMRTGGASSFGNRIRRIGRWISIGECNACTMSAFTGGHMGTSVITPALAGGGGVVVVALAGRGNRRADQRETGM